MVNDLVPSEILSHAKNLIKDERLWVKGAMKVREFYYFIGYYKYCALGAIEESLMPLIGRITGSNHDKENCLTCKTAALDADRFLQQAIIERHPELIPDLQSNKKNTIFIWNDDPKTTHEEVMEVFNRAIILAKLVEMSIKEEMKNGN